MAKFPEPPSVADLVALGIRPSEACTLAAGTRIWRIYFQAGPHPALWNDFRGYGPTDARFDHHLPPARVQTRQILYAASHGPICVAEVFQSTRTIDRTRRSPWLVAFEVLRDVTLLDLTGHWPTRAGASQAINSGTRKRARRWSRRIYDAFPPIEGIRYPSSTYENQPALALYERAESAMPTTPVFHRALADPALLGPLQAVASAAGYTMV